MSGITPRRRRRSRSSITARISPASPARSNGCRRGPARLREIGFFYALNHGVPEELVERAFAASRRFHALPLEEKLAEAERKQYRLSADQRLGAGGLDRAQGDQAQPERELFRQPRPRAEHPDVVAGKPLRGRNQWPPEHCRASAPT